MNDAGNNTLKGIDRVADEVFDLLKERGPLSPSQISAVLVIPIREVFRILKILREELIVEQRPDRTEELNADRQHIPWGLPMLFKIRHQERKKDKWWNNRRKHRQRIREERRARHGNNR